jgi:formiminotetrahydrofolate cyclodeaminase
MTIWKEQLETYLENVASSTPTPGGGSVASP